MLNLVFTNHVYIYNGKIYLQSNSGPIGLEITGGIARLILIWFDMQFIKLTEIADIKVKLYRRYIDFFNIAVARIMSGMKYDVKSNRLIFCPTQFELDKLVSPQRKTFIILQQIANSILDMIDWEIDLPENYEVNKLPVLDLNVYLDKSDKRNLIKHEFIQKPMTNYLVIENKSAMPKNVKRSILIQEGLRRLRGNCLSCQ